MFQVAESDQSFNIDIASKVGREHLLVLHNSGKIYPQGTMYFKRQCKSHRERKILKEITDLVQPSFYIGGLHFGVVAPPVESSVWFDTILFPIPGTTCSFSLPM